MPSDVVLQMSLRREPLFASFKFTFIWFLSGMDSKMRLEVAFFGERFAAAVIRAYERLLTSLSDA